MIQPGEFFRSVELIWLLWLVSCLTLVILLQRPLRSIHRNGLRALVLREEGAAYSLTYVLTVPLYMLVVCLVVESTLILIAKMGSVYAAYAGARSQIVWQTARPNEAQLRTQQAVAQAMAPFASGGANHSSGALAPSNSQQVAYEQAYHQYRPAARSATYIRAKYLYAWKNVVTSLQITPNAPAVNDNLTVSFTYEAPIHTPIIGRLIGTPSRFGTYRVYVITSSATLQNEGSKAEDAANLRYPLGIDYKSKIGN